MALLHHAGRVPASCPAEENPVSAQPEWVLRGGCLKPKTAVVLEEIIEPTPNKYYVKLNPQAPWMAQYAVGTYVSRRPFAQVKLLDCIRRVYREKALASASQTSARTSVQRLGLDEDVPGNNRPGHRSRAQTRAEYVHNGVPRDITMPAPTLPNEHAMSVVVTACSKQEVYMELTNDNLTWLRNYLRYEIVEYHNSAEHAEPDEDYLT